MGGYAQSTEPERIRKRLHNGDNNSEWPWRFPAEATALPKGTREGWPRHVLGKRNHLLCLKQKHGSYPESMGAGNCHITFMIMHFLKLNPGIIYWWFVENRKDTWHLHQLGVDGVGRNWITEQKLKPWGVCEERGGCEHFCDSFWQTPLHIQKLHPSSSETEVRKVKDLSLGSLSFYLEKSSNKLPLNTH